MENISLNNKPKPIFALKGYTRAGQFALDATSLYESYAEAIEYVRTSKVVYPSQVISVDDKLRKVTKVYKVSYNPAYKQNSENEIEKYKYTLDEISIGNESIGIINFKGKLDSYDDLPSGSDVKNHDMYYVYDRESDTYISYVYVDGNWIKVDFGINYASKNSDGIITKELYQNLMGQTGPGIFYNPGQLAIEANEGRGAKAEDSMFINLKKIGDDDSLTILTEDKMKESIYSIMESKPPYIEAIYDHDLTEGIIGEEYISPQVKIIYHPNLGGKIKQVVVGSTLFEPKVLPAEIFTEIPRDPSDPNSVIDRYETDLITLPSFTITSLNYVDNKFWINLYYEENINTLYPSGTASDEIDMIVYDKFQYRYGYYKDVGYIYVDYNQNKNNKAKENEEIKIHLEDNTNGISIFEFKTPVPIKEIEYFQQNDKYFLNKMKKTEDVISDVTYYIYTWQGYKRYSIKGQMDFIVKL